MHYPFFLRRKNCFHTFDVNFIKKGDSFIDRCYGNAPFSNYKNDNFFLITTIKKRNFFSNFFKKKSIPCVNAAEYLSVFDVFYIYYKILIGFFKLKNRCAVSTKLPLRTVVVLSWKDIT